MERPAGHEVFWPTEAQINEMKSHFWALGVVASAWASFEMTIDLHALQLAQITSNSGLCFTAQIAGSARKLDGYISVAQFRGAKKIIGELNEFAKDTAGLAEQRNRMIHDPWLIWAKNSPHRLEISARKKLRSELVNVPSKNVAKLAIAIERHITRFLKIDARVKAEVDA